MMQKLRRYWLWWLIGAVVLVAVVIEIPALMVILNQRPVLAEPSWDSPETAALVSRACADCHSNKTQWPWYSYVPPVSLLVTNHVREGREKLNFSEWGVSGREQEIDEIIEVIREGEMPMPSYVRMHPEAALTAQEQEQLIAGFQRTFNVSAGSAEGGERDDDD